MQPDSHVHPPSADAAGGMRVKAPKMVARARMFVKKRKRIRIERTFFIWVSFGLRLMGAR
jgi:hypothetical protein